ncbi:MAG: hemolysin family protein [Bacteriovoracaceae bacterium]|nr:hemolysin family protein [Bacteriovoracaceae bacterium]
MSQTFEWLSLVTGLLASGFFSASEAALMSISVDRTRQLIEEGGARAKALQFLAERPNHILTTILVGNNLANAFIASMTTSIASRYFADDAIALSVGVTTMFILIFGEITPKTFARVNGERLALPCIFILKILYFSFYPVVHAFVWTIEKILGKNAQLEGRIVTRDDIEFMVSKAEEERTIDSKQLDLLSSILEFPTIKVKDIMVSRTSIVALPKTSSLEDVTKIIREVAHSRYPIFGKNLDDVLGFLHVKDLAFFNLKDEGPFDVTQYIKPPFFVYEHMKIQAVFDHMNRKKVHLALVKDENGIVVGMITLEDIMEEIMGEIQDEHDEDDDGVPGIETEEGIIVPSSISLRDLYNEYDVKIPLNDNYSTLTGFLLEHLGNNFPRKGQLVFWDGFSFEITRVKNYEIKEVKIKSADGEQHLYKKGGDEDSASEQTESRPTNSK